MNFIEADIQCPYCWQTMTTFIEPGLGQASYVEDCQVCCAPMVLDVDIQDGQLISITVERENT